MIAIIPAVSSFFVENFGCRATQADGAAIEQQLSHKGLSQASTPASANVIVLNTCTVTAAADRDVRARIRGIHRHNPDCRILVTGCYAQRAPAELAALPGVTWVVGNSHKHCIGGVVADNANFFPIQSLANPDRGNPARSAEVHVGDIFAHTELLSAPVFVAGSDGAGSDRTRPNLKVQDGCDNRCSFCIIPSVRGQSRSLALADVLAQVNSLVADGYNELVLSGINLGRWGRDFTGEAANLHFEDLVRAILEHTDLPKLRISSVEPMDWSDDLIGLLASSPRIARHAHVPLQSGSDDVLRRMHRKYRPWHYAEKIRRIRDAAPTAAIGADVMVGFPGESAEEFGETRALVEELPFTYLHVFQYSSRPGTPSAFMPGQVPASIVTERSLTLREIASRKRHAFMESFVGARLPAITFRDSNQPDTEWTEALTDNYLKLRLKGRHPGNRWLASRILGISEDSPQSSGATLVGTVTVDA